jgi:hypothetical protein
MGSGLKVPLAIDQSESAWGFTPEASSKLRSLATQDDFDLTPSQGTPLSAFWKELWNVTWFEWVIVSISDGLFFSPCQDEDYLFYPVYCFLADSRCPVKPGNVWGIGSSIKNARTRVPQGLQFEADIEHVITENVSLDHLLTLWFHEKSTFSID